MGLAKSSNRNLFLPSSLPQATPTFPEPCMNTQAYRPVLALLTVVLCVSCYKVPVTGRRAVDLVSDADVTRLSIVEFNNLKARYPLSRNRDQIEALNRVGQRLSRVVFWDMPNAEWEFVVFDVPNQINAFAMAGGKVGVFSGLFRIIHNDDQLASVIAHEIAHVTARHVHERLSQQMLVEGGSIAGGVAMLGSGAGSLTTSVVLQAYGISTGAHVLAFDRKKELESDLIGLHYMARAGFNPEEAIRVIEQLEAETAGQPVPPPWLSTHPSNPERLIQMIDEMPKVLEIYRQSSRQSAPVIIK